MKFTISHYVHIDWLMLASLEHDDRVWLTEVSIAKILSSFTDIACIACSWSLIALSDDGGAAFTAVSCSRLVSDLTWEDKSEYDWIISHVHQFNLTSKT